MSYFESSQYREELEERNQRVQDAYFKSPQYRIDLEVYNQKAQEARTCAALVHWLADEDHILNRHPESDWLWEHYSIYAKELGLANISSFLAEVHLEWEKLSRCGSFFCCVFPDYIYKDYSITAYVKPQPFIQVMGSNKDIQ